MSFHVNYPLDLHSAFNYNFAYHILAIKEAKLKKKNIQICISSDTHIPFQLDASA